MTDCRHSKRTTDYNENNRNTRNIVASKVFHQSDVTIMYKYNETIASWLQWECRDQCSEYVTTSKCRLDPVKKILIVN